MNARQKLIICVKCDRFTEKQFCKECGCYMPLKVNIPFAKCPLNKWLEPK